MLTVSPSRRDLLYRAGMGLGGIALSAILAEQEAAAAGVLAPKPPHHAPKAKR